jgi:hypothetical protein
MLVAEAGDGFTHDLGAGTQRPFLLRAQWLHQRVQDSVAAHQAGQGYGDVLDARHLGRGGTSCEDGALIADHDIGDAGQRGPDAIICGVLALNNRLGGAAHALVDFGPILFAKADVTPVTNFFQ